MLRLFKSALLGVVLVVPGQAAFAFSLLGPYDTAYQVQRISYQHVLPVYVDIGGPMNLGEEYRWNMRTVTYAIDPSVADYFGLRGMEEIRKAVAVLNALPPFSKMSADLSEFPLDTRRYNYEAGALGLIDLKSTVLASLMEQMGLAEPERFTWTLFARIPQTAPLVAYNVITRNFDPVTWEPSKYVNGTLYTYGIFEIPTPPYDWADAVELPVDPLAPTFTSVASGVGGLWAGSLFSGVFYSGLTRDDIGGLRYLYRPQNYNVERPVTGTTFSGGAAGTPVDPSTSTNAPITALRPGVDKITFTEAKYDSIFGPFITITNRYVDYFVTNNTLVKQYTQRILTNGPDILFAAADLGAALIARSTTTNWLNQDALNGTTVLAGPGVIGPGSVIVLGARRDFLVNDNSSAQFLFESGATRLAIWGSFDGTTNRPIVYPNGASIDAIESQVLHR